MALVAIVGRPNVGKSTLFNRLTGSKDAIVHDEPGVTRDRHYGELRLPNRTVGLVDTGGFDPDSADPMKKGIKRQIDLALEEADLVVCVLDASAPPTAADEAELALLRRTNKPVIYVANKADSPKAELDANELYRLGIEDLLAISALHGRYVRKLEQAIDKALPPEPVVEDSDEPDAPIRVAIIGKPNAGKSSLVNRLSGEERLLVDDRPGTTRDPIDTLVERDGRRFILVDTAGIRRRAKVRKEGDYVEAVSVLQAMRAIERCEVCVLLIDANEGVSEQDAKILGLAEERGRAIVIALNKIDLFEGRGGLKAAEEATRDKTTFLPWAPLVRISAQSGRGTKKLLAKVTEVATSFRKRVPTAALNRFFEQVLDTRPPPTQGGRAPRIYFITQAETAPPLFVLKTSHPDHIHFSYQRYVINQLRQAFGFEGVPVRAKYRARRRRE